jgi:hypothetical protein
MKVFSGAIQHEKFEQNRDVAHCFSKIKNSNDVSN